MNRFNLMKQAAAALFLVLFLAASALSAGPKHVFYFIGDGLGASQRQFSEFFIQEETRNRNDKLLMNTFEVAGMNTTYCADTLITDSAAAGTALASGIKTNQGLIGKDVNGNNVKTLMEAAQEKGMKTGIITTTRLTHATPAAFAAHNLSRDNENEIAEDLLKSKVDFFAGGGIRHFIPKSMKMAVPDAVGQPIKSKREDEQDLIKGFEDKGYATFIGMEGAKAFKRADFSRMDKAFSAFTYTHIPYEVERRSQYPDLPSLAAMTQAGITMLTQGGQGFFLMVEGGRIDHACHANDATAVIYDTLAFDEAVKTAFEFYQAHPEDTLIVVVGDHETGGMGLGMDRMGYKLDMTALKGARVSVEDTLAYGPGAYKGDRVAYKAMLARDFCLANLTEAETAVLDKAFDAADAGQTMGYYNLNPTALAAAHLLSQRANIGWTTTIHTATMIPLSATGQGAQAFGGFKDNTQIAQTMAKTLGLTL